MSEEIHYDPAPVPANEPKGGFKTVVISVLIICSAAIFFYLNPGKGPLTTPAPLPHITPSLEIAAKFPEGFSKDVPWRDDYRFVEDKETVYVYPEGSIKRSILFRTDENDLEGLYQSFLAYYQKSRAYTVNEVNNASSIKQFAGTHASDGSRVAGIFQRLDVSGAAGNLLIRVDEITPQEVRQDQRDEILRAFPAGLDLPEEKDAYIEAFVQTTHVNRADGERMYGAIFSSDESFDRLTQRYESFFTNNDFAYNRIDSPDMRASGIRMLSGAKGRSVLGVTVGGRGDVRNAQNERIRVGVTLFYTPGK